MMFTSPGSIALDLNIVTIYWYGIFIALAFLTGIFTSYKIAENFYPKADLDKFSDLAFILLLGAIIGARAYFVIFNWNYFASNIPEAFMLWNGGLSIHGAILGGFISGSIYVKKHNMPLCMYADIVAFGLPVGQAIGRWGNFFNSEAFGSPTNLPWKLYIPYLQRPQGLENFKFFHPTFLYESIWNIFVFCILFFIIKNKTKNFGEIFFSYLILYSIGRLVIEPLRIDSINNPLGIPIAIWASILLIILGLSGLFITKRKRS